MKLGRIHTLFINLDTRVQLVLAGVIVGLCSGLAAVGLNQGLHVLEHLLEPFQGRIHLILLPVAGIFLTVIFLKFVVRDFGGHGVPDVIYSISARGGRIKFRSAFSKLLASLLTIASGGSAGPEAPVIISGAAIGSNVAGYLNTNDKIRVAVAGSGAAAAIAAIFNAPITGVIFTMEVILGEWTTSMMLPVGIASVTGTVISRLLSGNQIPFQHRVFDVNVYDILASLGLAFLIALISLVFIRSLKGISSLLDRWPGNDLAKALLGGGLVGGCVLLFPQVRGEGYEVVRLLIGGQASFHILLLLALIVMKMAATSLTLGAGGSGGVFAPSLVIGSLGGWFYFQILVTVFPDLPLGGASLFALVGMAGMISSTMHAPLSGIFLIVEITGGYDAILPLLLVAFLGNTLVKFIERHSIYHVELAKRGYLARPRTDARVLSEMRIEELLETDLMRVRPEMKLAELIPLLQRTRRDHYVVEDGETRRYLGLVSFHDIKSCLFQPELLNTVLVEEVMRVDLPQVSMGMGLFEIFKLFDTSGAWSLPVIENGRFQGLVSKATLLDHYRKELKAQTEL